MLIKMTPTDIQLCRSGKGNKCPLTYALMRVFYESKVEVHASFAFIDEHIIWFPDTVEKWLWEWDRRSLNVKIIHFEIPDPPKDLRFKEYH